MIAKWIKIASASVVLVTSVGTAVVWGGDTRYVKKDELAQAEWRRLNDEKTQLEIQYKFTENENQKKMLETMIKVKENRIRQLENK